MTTSAQTLSLERKLRMYEAREAMLSRIGSETFSVINLDHFLQATVTEVGKMMEVDRCDVITIMPDNHLRITHEYRASLDDDALPSSRGLQLPVSLERLQENVDLYSPQVIADTSSPDVPEVIRSLSAKLGSKSMLIVPITSNWELQGMIGLHHCRQSYNWKEDEINFMRSLAQQIAIGYRYTEIYSEKEKEARVTKALLEIANDINSGSDYSEVTARILDKSLDLLRLQAACLAVVDANNSDIHFTNLRTAAGTGPDILKQPSLKIPLQIMLPKTIEHGQMLRILSRDQSDYTRVFLTEVFSAGAAIIAPIMIEDQIFGGLVLLWSQSRKYFTQDETALTLGIADQLAIALSKASLSAEVLRLRRELEQHAHGKDTGSGFVGKSNNVMRCMEMARYVADSYTTVLLEGESGTGKEMMADLIQSRSSRAGKPYIKINCGAIPESLLESELFGHEKGAFTDARNRRIGKFEEANGGTLFLDEIGEMSLAAQVRLLRVLQNGEIARVGGNEVIKTDVRVIAASNINLEEAVRDGRFRRDLFYRLNVYPIKLPPLRERRDDIPLLAIHFLEIYKKRSNKDITGVLPKALARLRLYDWPGNVRELENAIERAVIIAQGKLITVDDLPDAVRGAEGEEDATGTIEVGADLPETVKAGVATDTPTTVEVEVGTDPPETLEPEVEADARRTVEVEVGTKMDDIEKRVILETLAHTRGDKSRAAQILGIGRKTLYRKLQQYKSEEA